MGLCRLATAIGALALTAGLSAGQVTEILTPTDTKAATAEKVVAPAETQTEPAPIQVSSVPEPGSILLLTGSAAATGGWVVYWRRRWRAGPATEPKTQP